MLKPDIKRQASVGEEGLLIPDHHTNDGLRGTRNVTGVSLGSGVEGLRQEGSDRNSTGSAKRKSKLAYIGYSMNMLDSPAVSINSPSTGRKTLGEAGTFRSAAMARTFVGSSRRHLLREEQQALTLSTRSGENMPLNQTNSMSNRTSGTIPEDQAIGPPGSGISPEYHTIRAIKSIIIGKPVCIFLFLIPFAIWSHYGGWGANYVFWLNFCVMIPLAAILGDFTEEAALHTNETIGGLLNATFGNAVEVVVAIQALLANEIRVVQASMIGSIFSNLLLVLGCCFFFGGLKYKEQTFNATAATANMGLLALSSIALVLPTPFAAYYNVQDEHVLIISRFAAVFLLFMYLQLLIFQLYTHKHIFNEKDEQKPEDEQDDGDEQDEEPSMSMRVALIGLMITTLLVTFFSAFLVTSIDEFCEISGISRTFVGLIILPIVGNAVEHITAITVAMKNKMDLAMGVAVGSCTQISLFVVPLTVLVGWATGKPMTLNFPHFEITLYILSVFTVAVCLSNPKGNWLEGSLLITTYIMIAIGFWFEKVVDFR